MLTLQDVLDACAVLRNRLEPSPLLKYGGLLAAGSPPVLLKAECLMPTGSFKIRGATYSVACLDKGARQRGVVAYSTGNHAQAVARAAHDEGVRAIIVMSPDATASKVEATKRWGAEVAMAAASSQARREMAEDIAAARGLALIPPYDDPRVMAGQGTIGTELLQQLGDTRPAAVFVPIGGGGLISGVATALKELDPSIAIIGVEPELESDACRSFQSGQLEVNPAPSQSRADAIRVESLGQLAFPIIQRRVDDIVTVTEGELAAAVRDCYQANRLVVEAAGAAALAAARREALEYQGARPIVALLSGGNVTLRTLIEICES